MSFGYIKKKGSENNKFKKDPFKGNNSSMQSCFMQRAERSQFNASIDRLVKQLARYDQLRMQVEERGGKLNLLVEIINALNESFFIQGLNHSHKVALTDQESLRSMLLDLGEFDCCLQVRKLNTGMPAYFLCHVDMDSRSTYSLILEDLYRSFEYPFFDKRFVKIMQQGHEVYFLRLSMFRQDTFSMLGKVNKGNVRAEDVDKLLSKVGHNIFQAAWHEDQSVAMTASSHFGLTWFSRAVELLYLCLSGEICQLRRIVDSKVLQFFVQVYPQPAIFNFLNSLGQLDGEGIARLPRKALELYPRLLCDFDVFLRTEVPWGQRKSATPLFKLLFANFWRMEMVCREIGENKELRQASQLLERQSWDVIKELLMGRPAM